MKKVILNRKSYLFYDEMVKFKNEKDCYNAIKEVPESKKDNSIELRPKNL